MTNLRFKIKNSDKGIFYLARCLYYGIIRFSIPGHRLIWRPIWLLLNSIRNIYYWMYTAFWVSPIYKGLCERIGKRFRAGTFLPYVIGKGKIFIGDNVTIHGKVDFVFGSIKKEIPEIHIGSNTGIGHNVRFDISSTLIIGEDCLIAKDVSFHDSSGHHLDPDMRKAKVRINEKQVRPIVIGNNVWIGEGAYISPGTQIGDNSVISANAFAGRKIPPNSLVYSLPSKVVKIRKISNII